MSESKHKNYEILNLIGYGLAKFNNDFTREFSLRTVEKGGGKRVMRISTGKYLSTSYLEI